MRETLFISDLHLCEERPVTVSLFRDFMEQRASRAAALYLLGDLFEVWVGDDDRSAVNQLVEKAIRRVVLHGTQVYFMHGNRDFLIAQGFAERTGCRLLPDPSRMDLYGTPTLLMHGDSLCTDDHAHQHHRAMVNSADWQRKMLAHPLAERLAMGKRYRQASIEGKQRKPSAIMDVNQEAVEAVMRQHRVRRLIHGHTHRPAVHDLELDGHAAQRFVLAQWDTTGAALCWGKNGYRVEPVVLRRHLGTMAS